jgi:predicted phosphoadenosine phosphosulfate sulfurtransferase
VVSPMASLPFSTRTSRYDKLQEHIIWWSKVFYADSAASNYGRAGVSVTRTIFESTRIRRYLNWWADQGQSTVQQSLCEGKGQFCNPIGMAYDSTRKVCVSDSGNHHIQGRGSSQ